MTAKSPDRKARSSGGKAVPKRLSAPLLRASPATARGPLPHHRDPVDRAGGSRKRHRRAADRPGVGERRDKRRSGAQCPALCSHSGGHGDLLTCRSGVHPSCRYLRGTGVESGGGARTSAAIGVRFCMICLLPAKPDRI